MRILIQIIAIKTNSIWSVGKINSHVHDSILLWSWRLHLIFFKISSWSHQEFHLYINKIIDYPVSIYFRNQMIQTLLLVTKYYTNSTRISRFEIVCKIVSCYDRNINLHCLSVEISLNRKWAGSFSWCNSIHSTSSDDDLRIPELVGVEDTNFFQLDIIRTSMCLLTLSLLSFFETWRIIWFQVFPNSNDSEIKLIIKTKTNRNNI